MNEIDLFYWLGWFVVCSILLFTGISFLIWVYWKVQSYGRNKEVWYEALVLWNKHERRKEKE